MNNNNNNNNNNPEIFLTVRKVWSHLPHDLVGGIHTHGLVPFLQSINKTSTQEHVWMGGIHALPWMVDYVIQNHQEELQQSNNKLVCIVIPSGDPRLELFHQFITAPGPYTGYVNPAVSPSIVPVYAEDTVESPTNVILDFLANAPPHPTSVVPLLTEEQKRERRREWQQRSYQRSEANQCSFSKENCKKLKTWRCNGMCWKYYKQSLK